MFKKTADLVEDGSPKYKSFLNLFHLSRFSLFIPDISSHTLYLSSFDIYIVLNYKKDIDPGDDHTETV